MLAAAAAVLERLRGRGSGDGPVAVPSLTCQHLWVSHPPPLGFVPTLPAPCRRSPCLRGGRGALGHPGCPRRLPPCPPAARSAADQAQHLRPSRRTNGGTDGGTGLTQHFYKLPGPTVGGRRGPPGPYQHAGPWCSKVAEHQPTRQGQQSERWLWRGGTCKMSLFCVPELRDMLGWSRAEQRDGLSACE